MPRNGSRKSLSLFRGVPPAFRRGFLTAAAGAPRGVLLPGTFLQFWAAHLDWPDERWRALFGYLEHLQVREVVIQWSRYDQLDYAPLVERVLAWGGRARVRVWIGLCYESLWWRALDEGREATKAALERALEADLRLAARQRAPLARRDRFRRLVLAARTRRRPLEPARLGRAHRSPLEAAALTPGSALGERLQQPRARARPTGGALGAAAQAGRVEPGLFPGRHRFRQTDSGRVAGLRHGARTSAGPLAERGGRNLRCDLQWSRFPCPTGVV